MMLRAMHDTLLSLWTVYDNPDDFPGQFVARLWEVTAEGPKPTVRVILSPNLNIVRAMLSKMGLVKMGRQADDDPCIVENWV